MVRNMNDRLPALKGGALGYREKKRSRPLWEVRREVLYTLLMMIPPGSVTTYGSLARLMGTGPRVVGRLLAENENVVIVPCHRVVRSDGSLGGYSSGGEAVKRRLLEIEGVVFRDGKVDPRCIIDLSSLFK